MGVSSFRSCFLAVISIGTVALAAAPRQTTVAPAGTATLTGVLLAGSPARAVRRATVRVIGATGTSTRLAGTGDDGRFVFGALPAGSYTLSATKPGYITTFHGAKRPGHGPGVPIAIADGARVDVTLEILPGAAITGTITDALGNPTLGVPVVAVDLSPTRAAPPARVVTDDRGMYRIFGLAPGDYLISAIPRLVPTSVSRGLGGGETVGVTEAEVRWARGLGALGPLPPPGRLVAYAPIYYPGIADAAAAERVSLKVGEERSGVGMSIRVVPVATIAGTLIDGDGQPIASATVQLHPRRRDGPSPVDALVSSGALVLPRATVSAPAFSIAGVAPGEYTIVARTGSGQRGAPPPDPAGPGPLWSVTDLSVDGNDQPNLVLRLLPGLKLSGSIVFERTSQAPPQDLSSARPDSGAVGLEPSARH